MHHSQIWWGRTTVRLQLRNMIVAACAHVLRQSPSGAAVDESTAMQVTEVLPTAFDALAAGIMPQADAFTTTVLHEQAQCPSQLCLSGLSKRTMVLSGHTSRHATAVYQTQQGNSKMFGVWLIGDNNTPYEHVAVEMHELARLEPVGTDVSEEHASRVFRTLKVLFAACQMSESTAAIRGHLVLASQISFSHPALHCSHNVSSTGIPHERITFHTTGRFSKPLHPAPYC